MAYAEQYRIFVELVAAVKRRFFQTESACGGQRLSMAVATYLFNLTDYKDEYEMAPPSLAKHDAPEHLINKEFGAMDGCVRSACWPR